MSTLLASDGISSLQRNLCVAVTTKVIDRWAFDGDSGLEVVAAWKRRVGRDLICFARHLDLRLLCYECDVLRWGSEADLWFVVWWSYADEG